MPPARELSDHERELLLGPPPARTVLKRVQLRDVKSKRWITYSGTNTEQSARVSSSFVSLKEFNKPPQFGRINCIFAHTFAKLQTIFVELTLFDTPVFHSDLNMCHHGSREVCHKLNRLHTLYEFPYHL